MPLAALSKQGSAWDAAEADRSYQCGAPPFHVCARTCQNETASPPAGKSSQRRACLPLCAKTRRRFRSPSQSIARASMRSNLSGASCLSIPPMALNYFRPSIGTGCGATTISATELSLAIVIARSGGRLVMVLPFAIERTFGLRQLVWMGAPLSQYGDVLIDAGIEAAPALRAAWSFAMKQLKPDLVWLRKVRDDAAVTPLMREIGAAVTQRLEAPYIDLIAPAAISKRTCSGARRAIASASARQRSVWPRSARLTTSTARTERERASLQRRPSP